MFASGFLRTVSAIVGVFGVLAGVVTAIILGRHGHTGNGLIIGISVAFGSVFYSSLLWLLTDLHDDVADIRKATVELSTEVLRELRQKRADERAQPWPGPDEDTGSWERAAPPS